MSLTYQELIDTIESNPSGVREALELVKRQLAAYPETTQAELEDALALFKADGSGATERVDVETLAAAISARQVDSVSDLQSGSYPASLNRIWLSGYYGVGTAGGGPLYRDSSDTTTADNGGTVFVDADGVRWKRPNPTYITAEEAGCNGDGTTDDTDRANAALSALKDEGGGTLAFDSEKTYLIDGGSNTAYSERGVNMTDGLVVPSNVTLRTNGCRFKFATGGATASDQYRCITNETTHHDGTLTESTNIRVAGGLTLEFAGTDGYYGNGIWINGGPLSNGEHWAHHFYFEDTIKFEGVRVGLVMRDENTEGDTGVADSEDTRMIGFVYFDKLIGKNVKSALIAPDADYVEGNLVSLHNDTLSGFDCYSMVRGHHHTIGRVSSTNANEYGCLIRSIDNSHTSDINIGELRIDGGNGLLITSSSTAANGEITEEIHIGTAHLKNTSAVIEKRGTVANIRDITLGTLHVSGGASGGVIQSIGLRCEGVSSVFSDNVYIDNTDGHCVSIIDSGNISLGVGRAKRPNQAADILQVIRSNNVDVDVKRATNGRYLVNLQGTAASGLELVQLRFGSCTGFSDYMRIDQNSEAVTSLVKIDNRNVDSLSVVRENMPAATQDQFPTERDYVSLQPGLGLIKIIASGAITVDHETHRVDTESAAASDDLDTINGGFRGQVVRIGQRDNARDVTLKHATGNLRMVDNTDIAMVDTNEFWTFQFDGINWVQQK